MANFFKELQLEEAQQESILPSHVPKEGQEISEAAERVYERYGSDLSAFYRDVQKEITSQREISEKAPL